MAGGFIPVERPPGAIDIEEFAAATYAYERALEHGDYKPLLARLRAGKALPHEQALFADIYEKKLKRPGHRPPVGEIALRFRDLHLALCVLERLLKGDADALENAVEDTALKEEIGESTVYAAVKQHPNLFRGLSK
jgi:hypothetical protein